MCETQVKLVAWLDDELPCDEAAAVEAHVGECETCRARLAVFEKVTQGFNLYCDAVLTARTKPIAFRWAPALAIAAAAALIASFFLFSRRHAALPSFPAVSPVAASTPSAIPAPAPDPEPALRTTVHHKPTRPPAPQPTQHWQPSESTVEIAIPAESIFAPGAMPEGMRLIGELRIGSDGSVRQVRFRQ